MNTYIGFYRKEKIEIQAEDFDKAKSEVIRLLKTEDEDDILLIVIKKGEKDLRIFPYFQALFKEIEKQSLLNDKVRFIIEICNDKDENSEGDLIIDTNFSKLKKLIKAFVKNPDISEEELWAINDME